MSKGVGGMRRIGGALLGLAALAGVRATTPASTSRQAAIELQSTPNRAPAQSPASAPTSVIQNQMLMPRGLYRFYGRTQPIWNGVEKRGNRRGRSRFNYNR